VKLFVSGFVFVADTEIQVFSRSHCRFSASSNVQNSNLQVNLLLGSRLQEKHCKGLIFPDSVRIILLLREDDNVTERDQLLPISPLQQYESVAVYSSLSSHLSCFSQLSSTLVFYL